MEILDQSTFSKNIQVYEIVNCAEYSENVIQFIERRINPSSVSLKNDCCISHACVPSCRFNTDFCVDKLSSKKARLENHEEWK